MKYKIAILVHSWFSWACAREIAEINDSSGQQTLYIFSRGFNLNELLPNKSKSVRFERYEHNIITNRGHELGLNSITNLGLGNIDEIEELIIPHLAYKPFVSLAKEHFVKTISFYQESIQLPSCILCRREATLLLDKHEVNSLFTSTSNEITLKLTNRYYNLGEKFLPLSLISYNVGNIVNILDKNLPREKNTTVKYDYTIVGGKAMNCNTGAILIENIIRCLSTSFENPTILFKASPSSSIYLEEKIMLMKDEFPMLTYMDGNKCLERLILDNKISNLISEMFTLAALWKIISNTRESLISVESTIILDYPSLKGCLPDRTNINKYKEHALFFPSLSEHILTKLAIT